MAQASLNTGAQVDVRIAELHVHPVKSCARLSPVRSLLVRTGLEFDRAWMVVDGQGRFVTQRETPRMALVRPALTPFELVLNAPAMPALHVALDAAAAPVRATLWNDVVAAFDIGDAAARWFSDFLGSPMRLLRFDPQHRRLSNRQWSRGVEAENAFSDAYPLLAISTAGLDELNRRLQASGAPGVTSERFRPNLVLDGLDANGEDHLDEIVFEGDGAAVRLKLAKPCVRCSIPDVDPATGLRGHAVGDTLAAYRSDARVGAAITFGMNAVLVQGIGCALHTGMRGSATYRFE